MSTESATSFVADGPTLKAFETGGNNTGITFGVNVQGTRCGVYGESIPGAGADRDSDIPGVGVCGKGSTVSVYGQGNHGDAGVLGTNVNGRLGVVGAVMRGGAGIVGLSVESLGNPAGLVHNPLPDPADGTGTGVLGSSGSGGWRGAAAARVAGVYTASATSFVG